MKFLLVILFAAAASASFAPLLKAKERIAGSYIVVLNDGESLTTAVNNLRSSAFFSSLGGRVERVYGSVLNGFSATLSEKALEFIRKMDIVEYVEEDAVAHTNYDSWGLDRVDQRYGMDNSFSAYGTGAGVHVYVIDTGIRETHGDFVGRIGEGYDFVDNDAFPNDCNGHGTHCAGTIGGTTYGVAKDVTLHALRVFPCVGGSAWSTITAAMDWVAANHISPAVASMSLGGGFSRSVNRAADNMVAAGVTVVVAAGNDNDDASKYSPASADSVITVGSSDSSDARSSFSNWGSSVDIFAPGSSITSCWWTGDSATKTISGTSMATPHVAGAVALFLQKSPGANPLNAKDDVCNRATQDCNIRGVLGSANCLMYVGNE